MDPIPLMATAEIRVRLGGVSPQRVYEITTRADFPSPVATLRCGRIWHRDDVEAWIRAHREQIAEDTETQP